MIEGTRRGTATQRDQAGKIVRAGERRLPAQQVRRDALGLVELTAVVQPEREGERVGGGRAGGGLAGGGGLRTFGHARQSLMTPVLPQSTSSIVPAPRPEAR